jgi:tRNA (mo5U34)-methyltransferase
VKYLTPYDSQIQIPALLEITLQKASNPAYKRYQDILANPDSRSQKELAKQLIPWKKGPFELQGFQIDAEWRSDFKWSRIKSSLGPLEGKKVLDIGCNNGYFLFQMAKLNPQIVLGIDPTYHFYAQFKFLQDFYKAPNVNFELLGVEHLNHFNEFFDVILSMGIIYHHRNPIEQLQNIKGALKKGGKLILETIGIPGKSPMALFPRDRYAKMKNIWFIPTLSCLVNWAHKTKFCDIEVISDTPLTSDEQRNTVWCPRPHQTLIDFLDPKDPSKTIEGFEAPRRFALSMRKKA